jgi:predicted dehydrogenase
MDEKPTIAIVGLGSAGRRVADAIKPSESVRLVAASDRDQAAIDAAGLSDLATFTDHRLMLEQSRPNIVYIALPPGPAAELVESCAQRGIHIIKDPPLARSLGEAAGLLQLTEQAGVKYAIATPRRFMPSYQRAFDARGSLGPLMLARAHYLFNWGPLTGWRADWVSAGGGALLELGYPLIDLLTWMVGLPEDVFGSSAVNTQVDLYDPDAPPAHPSTTDDTAAAVMRSAGGAMASLVVSRVSGPLSEELALHGRNGTLTITPQQYLLRDADGRVLDQSDCLDDPAECIRLFVEAFAASLDSGTNTYPCSARENLLTMAVLEALYLSDKTATAENPRSLLQAAGFGPEDCLIHRRPT